MKIILTEAAPAPGGHYSQGIVHGGLVFTAGQLPINPQTGEKITGTIEEQARQVLANVAAVLAAGGSSITAVIKMTVYVADITLWDRVNRVYAEFFGEHRPARSVVPTARLHHGFLIEAEAVGAVLESGGNRD